MFPEMNILLLAPHPFYQERGTPIAVDLLLRVLSARGDKIDVLTYHEGKNRDYGANVRLLRIAAPKSAIGVKPGFTLKKLICDYYMRPMAFDLCRKNKYDIVHAIEEAVFMAMEIKKRFGIPYVMDMDSSMPDQIADKLGIMRPILPIMRAFEKNAVRKAKAVIAVCDALADLARKYGNENVTVLRDISLLQEDPPDLLPPLKEELNIPGLCYMYIGNLEKYQGVDLMLKSFAIMQSQTAGADLVIIGGTPEDIAHYQLMAKNLSINTRTHFLGPKPVSMMGSFFKAADVLVSPRTTGGNTPMKIYSYLGAGKAILATNLSTHTQILDETCALLETAEPEPFAQGMIRLLQNAEFRGQISKQAKKIAREKYSLKIFSKTLNSLYDKLRPENS